MKLYLANMISLRAETLAAAHLLRDAGHEIVSSWVYGAEEGLTLPQIAVLDVTDLQKAEAIVKFTQPYGTLVKGGGRHAEGGMGLVLGKKVFLVGPREQIFDWHPDVIDFPTLDHLIRYLKGK
jgi:hypothetical protein